MEERRSPDDASVSGVSLVDSRRLLFEKIVTEKATTARPERAGDGRTAAGARLNGRLRPQSAHVGKVNSFRDQLGVDKRRGQEAPPARRHSDGVEFGSGSDDDAREANSRTAAVDGRVVDSSAECVGAPTASTPSRRSASSAAIGPADCSPSSSHSPSPVPRHKYRHSTPAPPSPPPPPPASTSVDGSSPVPSSPGQVSAGGVPSPGSSKRVSYHHAVMNGAALKSRPKVSPLPVTASETDDARSASRTGGNGRSPSPSSDRPEPRVSESTTPATGPTAAPPSARAASPAPGDGDLCATAEAPPLPSSPCSPVGCQPAAPACATEPAESSSLPATPIDAANSAASAVPPLSAAAAPAPAANDAVEYPEDLNPFEDEDDADDDGNDRENRSSLETSEVHASREHDSTNPFGSDSEDDEVVQQTKSTTPASTNPFWSGSDNEEEEDGVEKNPRSKMPIPLPRTVVKTLSSPQPSPRPRSRVVTGCCSNEISPATSCHKLSVDSSDVAFHRSSSSINSSTSRKKKPAPPPPPLQANSYHLVSPKKEQNQNSNEQSPIVAKSFKTNPNAIPVTDLNHSASKKVISPWKNKKRPAPARPTPLRRPVKEMPLEDIKTELNDIEIRYQELERQTAQLEEKIHFKNETESPESSVVEEMVVQLFELVNEKNELFRRRSQLVNMNKMHSLEVEQADIEYEIRCLMLRPESNKTDTDKATEEVLLKRLVEVVEKRNEIIDLMDQDRLRETVEDESVTTQIEPKKNGHDKKDGRTKEKKKKMKKEKNKETDEVDKHSPSKLIKQKFMTLRHTAKKLHPKLPD